MVIKGIGIDMVSIERIRCVWEKFGSRFVARILHTEEQDYFTQSHDPIRLLAGRFAVKEAASKALGLGIGRDISWRYIFARHNAHGAPQLRFTKQAEHIVRKKCITDQQLTLTYEGDYVVAMVVLSGTPSP